MHEQTKADAKRANETRDRVLEPFSIGRGTEEGSQHRDLLAGIDDPQELRALELEALGHHRDAARIRACRCEPFIKQVCRIRMCPQCANDRAAALYRKALSAMRRMDNRTLCLVTVTSHDLTDLRETTTIFRAAFTALRRRSAFRAVRAVVAVIEPKLTRNGRRWAVHAHPILDVAIGSLDIAVIDKVFSTTVARKGRRGSFCLSNDRPNVDDGSIHAVARYVTKSTDISPAPGTMQLRHLEILRASMRGVRVPLFWTSRTERTS